MKPRQKSGGHPKSFLARPPVKERTLSSVANFFLNPAKMMRLLKPAQAINEVPASGRSNIPKPDGA